MVFCLTTHLRHPTPTPPPTPPTPTHKKKSLFFFLFCYVRKQEQNKHCAYGCAVNQSPDKNQSPFLMCLYNQISCFNTTRIGDHLSSALRAKLKPCQLFLPLQNSSACLLSLYRIRCKVIGLIYII